jgi:hypothetical protein
MNGTNDIRHLATRLRAKGNELIQVAEQLAALCAAAETRPAARRRLERAAVGVLRLLARLDEQFGPDPGGDDA